jgi:Uma2 family endonuclease
MTQVVTPTPPASPPEADPYRYGWRYVRRVGPDGSVTFDQVPLTLEDVLHPQEEDCIPHDTVHEDNRAYVRNIFHYYRRRWPSSLVLCDVRVALNVPGVRPHGPDIAVFFNVRDPDRVWSTFNVAVDGVRSVLLMEITSSESRVNDIDIKVDHYHRAGVPLYIIVDRLEIEDPVELIGYYDTPQGYKRIVPDAKGRLSLGPLGLLLGVRGHRVVLYDASTGEELLDYATVVQQIERDREARKAVGAHARIEAEARRAVEAQVAELQARLRQLEARLPPPPGAGPEEPTSPGEVP